MLRQPLHILTILAVLALPAPARADDDIRVTKTMSLDGTNWQLATDPQNIGREQQWYQAPQPEAKPTRVPWIIQETFPAYHGVAWYWRDFDAPANPHDQGRALLRFWMVDYLAEVWLNDVKVGGHEGGEGVFVLDVTNAIKTGKNRLAVRVLNPTNEPIDGIALGETPRRCKVNSFNAGALYNDGGIVDSVELILAPVVYLTNLDLRPNPKTGVIHVRASAHNTLPTATQARFAFTVASAPSGETLETAYLDRELPSGDTLVETSIQVGQPRLWELNDPYLYRVTVRAQVANSPSIDERSSRCGFRDFCFQDGYFRLNGKRVFLKCSHTSTHYPIGLHWPHDPDLARRDLLLAKSMGFNSIRFFCSLPTRYQIDLCDELGLMVYEECFAGWCLQDSPKMVERFDRETSEMIVRDRNHPSIVMWGLLNETSDGPVFRHAVDLLPLVRTLDDTRIVMLDSGLFNFVNNAGGGTGISKTPWGALSNPGSIVWEDALSDQHPYKRVPHTAGTIRELRTAGDGDKPVFISEYGVGSGVDLAKTMRHFEQLGAEQLEDAQWYKQRLDQFMVDWKRWSMEDTFANPEDFFAQCLAKMGRQRLLGLNAIRANPKLVAYSMTGLVDQANCGEGLFTTFRDLKPGAVDDVFDGWYPLRWCLFAEPVNVYRKTPVRLEAVLANDDMLKPGEYPARLQVVGPGAKCVFDRTINVTIPDPNAKPEPPMAMTAFAEDVVIDGPPGKYRFLVTFERGAAAAGGETEFYVADPAEMPKVDTEVVLWGDDAELVQWLKDHDIRTRPFSSVGPTNREVILASSSAPSPGGSPVFRELAQHIARGSAVVFLSPAVFANGDQPTAWLPLAKKGSLVGLPSWLYHKDEWTKNHPIFDGLPAGGLMDYTFYREIIPDGPGMFGISKFGAWAGQDPPADVVAGATNTSQDYSAGLMLSVNNLGTGRFVLNTLLIRENLGHPVADRLLLNMLRYAGRDAAKPLADLPADFDTQLKAMGY